MAQHAQGPERHTVKVVPVWSLELAVFPSVILLLLSFALICLSYPKSVIGVHYPLVEKLYGNISFVSEDNFTVICSLVTVAE